MSSAQDTISSKSSIFRLVLSQIVKNLVAFGAGEPVVTKTLSSSYYDMFWAQQQEINCQYNSLHQL